MGTIADKLQKVLDTKDDIKDAIVAKGVSVPSSATFASYPTYIGQITTGITPTGNINITNTNSTDVTNYATAQVVDSNLTGANIISGKTILGVSGTFTYNNYYTGSSTPSSSLGSDGDIYLMM